MTIHTAALIHCIACLSFAGLVSGTVDAPIAGRSLAEWRDLMNRIELRDPESRRFVPGLIQLMDDATVPWITRRQAALTLGRLGPLAKEAVPQVIRHLDTVDADDPETSPRRWALSALALFGQEASAAAPRLIALLGDGESSRITKLGCLEALSQIGSASPDAIPAIIAQLERHDAPPDIALGAVEALGMVGPEAAVGVPVLMRKAQSEQADLRREAVRALGRIGPLARVAQLLLCEVMLDDDSAAVRDAAMTSLGQTGPDAWEYVEALLSSDETEIRERAATVVSGWSAIANKVLPALAPLLADSEPRVRLAAARSYRMLAKRHDSVWPVLMDLLEDSDRELRRAASKELQAIVQTEKVRGVDLARMTEDPRPNVRREGARLRRLQARVPLPPEP